MVGSLGGDDEKRDEGGEEVAGKIFLVQSPKTQNSTFLITIITW